MTIVIIEEVIVKSLYYYDINVCFAYIFIQCLTAIFEVYFVILLVLKCIFYYCITRSIFNNVFLYFKFIRVNRFIVWDL